MRRVNTILLLCAVLVCAACKDEEAREYARHLADTLKSYKTELNKKIKAEQEASKMQATTYAYTQQTDALLALENDRFKRAGLLAESLLQGSKLSPSDIQRLLGEYAKQDFDATRAIFEKDADDLSAFLTGVETLELQAQSIDALIAALEELAQDKSRIEQLKEAGVFAARFKEKLDELQCQELARAIKCLEAQANAAQGDEKTALQGQINRLKQQLTSDGCAAKVLSIATCQN